MGAIAYKHHVVPAPTLNRGVPSELSNAWVVTVLVNQLPGMVGRSTNSQMVTVHLPVVIPPSGKHPAARLSPVDWHAVPEPKCYGIAISHAGDACPQTATGKVNRPIKSTTAVGLPVRTWKKERYGRLVESVSIMPGRITCVCPTEFVKSPISDWFSMK
tara:strand:- start:26 stop:502 length:477 start_codon:yes stop_codon:yes gene_type:complete